MTQRPQEEFRSELSSLRDEVIRSVQEGIPSNIQTGLDIYRRLLEHLLKRFSELESISGRRPQYQLRIFSFGDTSGQELGWLESDYVDFLQQALRSADPVVIIAVARGLFDLVTSAGTHNDVGAFRQFLSLVGTLWGDAKMVIQDEMGWTGFRTVALEFLHSVAWIVLSTNVTPTDHLANTRTSMEVLVAKVYSDAMRNSVDRSAVADLAATATSMDETFRDDWLDIVIANSQFTEPQRTFARGEIQAYSTAAIVGVLGLILFRWDRGGLNEDVTVSMRTAMRAVTSRPFIWSALPKIQSFDSRAIFGWSIWESSSRESRGGFVSQIDSYIQMGLLVAALDSAQYPRLEDFVLEADSQQSPQDVEFLARQFLSRLDEISEDPKWDILRVDDGAISSMRQALEVIVEQAQVRLVDELISRPLSASRVSEFHQSAFATWLDQPKVLGLFPSQEATDQEKPWVLFGAYRSESKEFFVESDRVFADTSMLAAQYVRAQLQGEAAYLIGRLAEAHRAISSGVSEVASAVEREVKRLRKAGHRPQVLVYGSWVVLEALRTADQAVGVSAGIGVLGTFSGAQVFWETAVGKDRCVVLDPSVSGHVLWRRLEPETGDEVNREGRFLSGVREIDETEARRLLQENPNFLGDPPPPMSEAIRTLRQRVLTRVREALVWEVANAEAGIVIEVSGHTGSELDTM